jgi:hypothetical protein
MAGFAEHAVVMCNQARTASVRSRRTQGHACHGALVLERVREHGIDSRGTAFSSLSTRVSSHTHASKRPSALLLGSGYGVAVVRDATAD